MTIQIKRKLRTFNYLKYFYNKLLLGGLIVSIVYAFYICGKCIIHTLYSVKISNFRKSESIDIIRLNIKKKKILNEY